MPFDRPPQLEATQAGVALYPLIEVDQRPAFAGPRPDLTMGPGCWWLLPALRRSVRVDRRHARLVVHEGCVLGLAVSDQAVPDDLHRSIQVPQHHREQSSHHGMVLVEAGRLVSASDPALLASDLQDHLGPARLPRLWGRHTLSWTRLHGDDEVPRYILHVRPFRRLAEPLFASLSRAQVETCASAIAGMSTREIAEHRGCTVETVRSHLKTTYQRVGLSSRVELQPVVDEWTAWCELFREARAA